MKTKKLFLILGVMLGLTSCNKDESPSSAIETDEGYIMIKIKSSESGTFAKTRATNPGTAAERKINSLHVYLFNKDGIGSPTIVHLTSDQITTDFNGVTTLNAPIRTSIKDKWGYVGTNLTQSMRDNISSSRNNLTNVGFEQAISNLANEASSSFVMFTNEIDILSSNIKTTEGEATNTAVSSSLSRLAAKTAVYYNNTVFEGEGTYDESSVEFAWRRINKQIYYVQKIDFTDPNYNPGTLTTLYQDNAQTYLPLNSDINNITAFQYTTENTFAYNPATIKTDDATCISLRVLFQPDNYTVKNAGNWQAEANSNSPSETAPDFWVVRVNSGITYYFKDNNTANQFWTEAISGSITINGVQLIPDDSTYTERRYVNGWCHYNVYPNHNGIVRDEVYRYNIFRNQYYRMALKKLTAPGDPNWDFDTNQPIIEYGYIQFELTVEDWELFDEDINM